MHRKYTATASQTQQHNSNKRFIFKSNTSLAVTIFFHWRGPIPLSTSYHFSQTRSLSNYPKINLTCDCKGNNVGKRCVREKLYFHKSKLFSERSTYNSDVTSLLLRFCFEFNYGYVFIFEICSQEFHCKQNLFSKLVIITV